MQSRFRAQAENSKKITNPKKFLFSVVCGVWWQGRVGLGQQKLRIPVLFFGVSRVLPPQPRGRGPDARLEMPARRPCLAAPAPRQCGDGLGRQ